MFFPLSAASLLPRCSGAEESGIFFNLLDLVCSEDGRRRKAISTFSRERRKIFRRHAGSSERGKIGKSY